MMLNPKPLASRHKRGRGHRMTEHRRRRPVLSTETLESRQMLSVTLNPIGRYATGIYDADAAEAVGYNVAAERIYVGNRAAFAPGAPDSNHVPNCDGTPPDLEADPPRAATPPEPCKFGRIDVVDASDPTDLGPAKKLFSIDISSYGMPTSIASKGNLLAVAVPSNTVSSPGKVLLFEADMAGPTRPLKVVPVGANPDMLTFTPDGTKIVVANEGQPRSPGKNASGVEIDPEGSVSIIDVSKGARRATETRVTFSHLNGHEAELNAAGIRVLSDRPAAQSIEPEYVAVHPDSSKAWVTLQENNAIAQVDLDTGAVDWLKSLGTKDHSVDGNGLDPSDRDGGIHIDTWPVHGMYQPDGITAFATDDGLYLATANEGDNFNGEDGRVAGLVLDETEFPNAAELQDAAALGRLNVSAMFGDTDGDGDVDKLYSFGARSFTIWSTDGEITWDSGDDFEQITATAYPDNFNASNTNNSLDNRSDDKGPEPTTVAVAKIDGRSYAVITIERTGGLMVYDVTTPSSPSFVQYVNTRDFSIEPDEAGETTDLHPENLIVVSADDSPTGKTLVIVSYPVSGSIGVFEFDTEDPEPQAASSVVVGVSAAIVEGRSATSERVESRRNAAWAADSPRRRLAAVDSAFDARRNASVSIGSSLHASRAARPEFDEAIESLSTLLVRSLGRS